MDSICQRLRQLFNRDRPELPPPPAIDPLSDAGYERLYFKLLDRADEGWTRSQFLEQWDDRLEDKFFKSWLRRFGDKLLSSPAPNRELAQRMVHLGTSLQPTISPSPTPPLSPSSEDIANLSTEYGRKLLDRELSPLAPEEYEPTFKQLLQKTANGKAAVLAFLRDFEARVSVAQWCEWLPGYGERLLAVEEPDQTTAKALLRLGETVKSEKLKVKSEESAGVESGDLSELAQLATQIGQEMREREIIWEVWEYAGPDADPPKRLQKGDTMTLGELQKRAATIRPLQKTTSNPDVAWVETEYLEKSIKNGEDTDKTETEDLLVQASPEAQIWLRKCQQEFSQGKYQEAVASVIRATEVAPDDFVAWSSRGQVMSIFRQYEEAIASFDKALEIKLDFHEAWLGRGQAMGKSPHPVSMPTTLILQHPHLNIPGYEGKLNSYEEGLKYCHQDTHPESWGQLHHYIGQAHYSRGRYDVRRRFYCQKAFESYNNALQTLTETAFPKLHLEVLQDLIKVLLALGEPEQAAEMRRRGSEVLRRLQANIPSEAVKQRLAFEFVSFQQYSVDLAVASGDCETAWELAEAGKNACLMWLLPEGSPLTPVEETAKHPLASPLPRGTGGGSKGGTPENLLVSPLLRGTEGGSANQSDFAPSAYTSQSQGNEEKKAVYWDLLDSNTAAIYWHVSPAALTTFVLFCDRPAIVISSPSGDEVSEGENDRLSQLLDWEKWLSDWNKQDDDYATKDSNASKTHPWRTQMEANLQRLGEILNINAILDCLGDGANAPRLRSVDTVRPYNLILVPHRDLHRFPLHYFFGDFACTYLPSISFGLQQQRQPWNAIDRLLLAENPKATPTFGNVKKSLAGLPFAEVEAALIEAIARENNSDVLRLEDNNDNKKITKDAIAAELNEPRNGFHFCGHGWYNSNAPANSCLFLNGDDRFTLYDIVNLDLSSYKLVSLAACETAVTGNQTITTEFVGLSSAFVSAGVRFTISTLWTVESAASAILMVEFYRQLQENSPAIALKTAQTWLQNATRQDLINWCERNEPMLPGSLPLILEDERDRLSNLEGDRPYSHPYFWAAFTVSGV